MERDVGSLYKGSGVRVHHEEKGNGVRARHEKR